MFEQSDGPGCRIFITADRKQLYWTRMNEWSSRPSRGVCDKKTRAIIAIEGPFPWSATLVAGEVQERQSMLLRESTEVKTDWFAENRDTVELHGQSSAFNPHRQGVRS